jgi:hypothetical protein
MRKEMLNVRWRKGPSTTTCMQSMRFPDNRWITLFQSSSTTHIRGTYLVSFDNLFKFGKTIFFKITFHTLNSFFES